MFFSNKIFNFLGDSITEGVGVSAPEKSFVNVFSQKYSPAAVRNYGIGGSRFAKQHNPDEGFPPHERYFCSRVEEMDPNADVIVVFGGINDYTHGDAPFGRFEDRTPDTFCGACHVLMKSLIDRYPLATIVFMTPLHSVVNTRNKIGTPTPLIEYVRTIRSIAEEYSIPVLDLYATIGIQPEIEIQRQLYMPDGLHPNDAGAERIADRLAAFLGTL